MTRGKFLQEVQCGRQLVIIDNSIIDVTALQDEKSGHKGGNVFNIGADNTFLFHELHANLPRMPSKHRPDLPSITAHIQEKVRDNFVAILHERRTEVPLSDPAHHMWAPSQRKPPYLEQVSSSLDATGEDASAAVASAIAGLEPGTAASRAFWAVVGSLVADAASQPTHWNYKVTYYQDALRQAHRWDNPEFITPSLNAYYRVPCGSHSCFGDQAQQQQQKQHPITNTTECQYCQQWQHEPKINVRHPIYNHLCFPIYHCCHCSSRRKFTRRFWNRPK